MTQSPASDGLFMLRTFLREVALFAICAIFTGTVGLILLDMVIMPNLVRKGMQVEVPDLVDLTPSQARKKLSRYGLRLRMQDPRWDDRILEGRIVSQNPLAFSRVKQNRTVYAVSSKGRRLYAVPDLEGKTLRQARLWIEQSELEVGEVTEDASFQVKEGFVMFQVPEAGEEVDEGHFVSLVISNGPPRKIVPVPNLVSRDLENARNVVAGAGLRVGTIRYEFSTEYLPNFILRQVPEPGEEVKRGTRIDLVVSKL